MIKGLLQVFLLHSVLAQDNQGAAQWMHENFRESQRGWIYVGIIVGVLLVCWIIVKVQYWHQGVYLKQKLPEAHYKLFRGIMAQEAVMQTEQVRRNYYQEYYAQARVEKYKRQDERDARAGRAPDAAEKFRRALRLGARNFAERTKEKASGQGLQYFDKLLFQEHFGSPRERSATITRQQSEQGSAEAKGQDLQKQSERKDDSPLEQQTYKDEPGISKSNLESNNSPKKQLEMDVSLSSAANLLGEQKEAQPATPGIRDGYGRSNGEEMKEHAPGLNESGSAGNSSGLGRYATMRQDRTVGDNEYGLPAVSMSGEFKTGLQAARALRESKSGSKMQQSKQSLHSTESLTDSKMKRSSSADQSSEISPRKRGRLVKSLTVNLSAQKSNYWQKLARKKNARVQAKRARKLKKYFDRQSGGPGNTTERSDGVPGECVEHRHSSQDTQRSHNNQGEKCAEEQYMDELEERKRKLLELYKYGQASKVGSRPGEVKETRHSIETDAFQAYEVSIFGKSKDARQDMHMRVINQHRAELVKDALSQHVKYKISEAFEQQNGSCCTCLKRFATCNLHYCFRQPLPFLNRHDIEDYIDKYFLVHVPDSLSVSHNHQKVYLLIHQLLMQEHEITQYESEGDHVRPEIVVSADATEPARVHGGIGSPVSGRKSARENQHLFLPGSVLSSSAGRGQERASSSAGKSIGLDIFKGLGGGTTGGPARKPLLDLAGMVRGRKPPVRGFSVELEGGGDEAAAGPAIEAAPYGQLEQEKTLNRRASTVQMQRLRVSQNSEKTSLDIEETIAQVLGKTQQNFGPTGRSFVRSPKTTTMVNATSEQYNQSLAKSFRRSGMQFRKGSTKKERPDRLDDDEIDPSSPIKAVREAKNQLKRDPIVTTQRIAETYGLPKPPVLISPRYPSMLMRPLQSPNKSVRSQGSEMVRTHGSFQERGFMSQASMPDTHVEGRGTRLEIAAPGALKFRRRDTESVAAGLEEMLNIESAREKKHILEDLRKQERQGNRRDDITPREEIELRYDVHARFGNDPNHLSATQGLQLHEAKKMLQHAEAINAIMVDIMPGLLQMCCSKYTADVVKAYFRRVRSQQLDLLQLKQEEQVKARLAVLKPDEPVVHVALNSTEFDGLKLQSLVHEQLPAGAGLDQLAQKVRPHGKDSELQLIKEATEERRAESVMMLPTENLQPSDFPGAMASSPNFGPTPKAPTMADDQIDKDSIRAGSDKVNPLEEVSASVSAPNIGQSGQRLKEEADYSSKVVESAQEIRDLNYASELASQEEMTYVRSLGQDEQPRTPLRLSVDQGQSTLSAMRHGGEQKSHDTPGFVRMDQDEAGPVNFPMPEDSKIGTPMERQDSKIDSRAEEHDEFDLSDLEKQIGLQENSRANIADEGAVTFKMLQLPLHEINREINESELCSKDGNDQEDTAARQADDMMDRIMTSDDGKDVDVLAADDVTHPEQIDEETKEIIGFYSKKKNKARGTAGSLPGTRLPGSPRKVAKSPAPIRPVLQVNKDLASVERPKHTADGQMTKRRKAKVNAPQKQKISMMATAYAGFGAGAPAREPNSPRKASPRERQRYAKKSQRLRGGANLERALNTAAKRSQIPKTPMAPQSSAAKAETAVNPSDSYLNMDVPRPLKSRSSSRFSKSPDYLAQGLHNASPDVGLFGGAAIFTSSAVGAQMPVIINAADASKEFPGERSSFSKEMESIARRPVYGQIGGKNQGERSASQTMSQTDQNWMRRQSNVPAMQVGGEISRRPKSKVKSGERVRATTRGSMGPNNNMRLKRFFDQGQWK